MDASALSHLLTSAEREAFEQAGYLVVKNAIESNLHRRLIEVVDRVDARERRITLTQLPALDSR